MRSHREAAFQAIARFCALDNEREDAEALHGSPDPDLTSRTVDALRDAQGFLRRAEDRLTGADQT